MDSDRLRLVDLDALLAQLREFEPEWLKILRAARVVEVRPTTYVEIGKAYMIDLSRRWIDLPPFPEDEGRIAILCSFEDEPRVRQMVDEFRKGWP